MGVYSFFSLSIVIMMMKIFKSKIFSIRKAWAYSMVKLIHVDIETTGTLDTNADMIILNHNSMFDITLLEHLHPKDIAWVANQKLADAPWFGYIFKLPKLILIDPNKRSSLRKLLKEAKMEHHNGRPIGLFPEGTRGNCDTIKKFQVGAKMVAESLNMNIQPIILVGTRERLDTKTFSSSAGKVKVIYLNTIKPTEKEWYTKLEEEMKTVYKKHRH